MPNDSPPRELKRGRPDVKEPAKGFRDSREREMF